MKQNNRRVIARILVNVAPSWDIKECPLISQLGTLFTIISELLLVITDTDFFINSIDEAKMCKYETARNILITLAYC